MDTMTLPVSIVDSTGAEVMRIEEGAADKSGIRNCTIVLPAGDIINVENIQGGRVGRPNLDIGAGGDGSDLDHPRGVISTNYDVGTGMAIGSGRMRTLARFHGNDDPAKDVVHMDAPTYLHKTVWVWSALQNKFVKLVP